MAFLIAGLVVFFGAHLYSALRSRADGRDMKVKMGEGAYMGLYSLVSLIGFVLIIYGYGAARPSAIVYQPPEWGQHLNMALMLPAFILFVASQLPTGWIKKATKHPMLVSIKLWALGHLLANGELISLLLFVSFLAYAVFDRIMVKRRGDTGPAADATVSIGADVVSVVLGGALYLGFFVWLHEILIGVPVIA